MLTSGSGTVIVGALYGNATSATECSAGLHYWSSPIPDQWAFIAVPIFTLCLIGINQGKWKQAPTQVLISFAGYQVNYWVAKRINDQLTIANAAGAFTVGLLANAYGRFGYTYQQKFSRWLLRTPDSTTKDSNSIAYTYKQKLSGWLSQTSQTTEKGDNSIERATYGLAAAIMLPAIWVQVPSGLAVSGSLLSGVMSADQITRSNATDVSIASSTKDMTTDKNAVLTVGFTVIQVAIGITVGLFVSTVLVYPRGKKTGGIFSM